MPSTLYAASVGPPCPLTRRPASPSARSSAQTTNHPGELITSNAKGKSRRFFSLSTSGNVPALRRVWGMVYELDQIGCGRSEAGLPNSNITPAFVRLPRAGHREPYSGLSRTQLFALIKTGRVKSHSLKTPGATRGVRLIDAQSLRTAIEGGLTS